MNSRPTLQTSGYDLEELYRQNEFEKMRLEVAGLLRTSIYSGLDLVVTNSGLQFNSDAAFLNWIYSTYPNYKNYLTIK